MVYSFDVFDTCLIRACGRPEIVFELLAQKILEPAIGEGALLDFAEIRHRGEVQARKTFCVQGREDITLNEIYEHCDFSDLTSVENQYIMQEELRIEKSVLLPVYTVKQQIVQLRNAGHKIIFISDMYLPQSFIKEVLLETGLWHEKDSLYVSSEFGVTKRSGHLFDLVRNSENIDIKNWTHSGDNAESDIRIPKKKGIKVHSIYHALSYYENLMGGVIPVSPLSINPLCAAFSRAIRLTSERSAYLDFAADFIAPLYVSFVSWLLEDATSKGIQRLYFFARDGYIFYKIAQTFQSLYPNIELHYLYVSRKALYLPGIKAISVEYIEQLVLVKTLLGALDTFQIEEEIEHFQQYEHLTGHDLITALVNDETFVRILKTRQKQQKKLLLQYLLQEGLHRGYAAIVDLNGSRNGQKMISCVLEQAGYPAVFGYFFTLGNQRIVGKDYSAMFFNKQLSQYSRFCVIPPVMMLEEYMSMADHPSTKFYQIQDGNVKPVLGQDTIELSVKQQICEINIRTCQIFARYYQEYVPKYCARPLCYTSLSVLSDFISAPIYSYIKVFEHLTFSWTPIATVQLLRKGSLWSLLKNRHSSSWFFGEFVYRFPFHNMATILLRIIRVIRRGGLKVSV